MIYNTSHVKFSWSNRQLSRVGKVFKKDTRTGKGTKKGYPEKGKELKKV